MTDPNRPVDPETMHQMAIALALEITEKVLKPKGALRTTVVIEAMGVLYEMHARTLSPDGMNLCARHLNAMAQELTQTSVAMQLQAGCATEGLH